MFKGKKATLGDLNISKLFFIKIKISEFDSEHTSTSIYQKPIFKYTG